MKIQDLPFACIAILVPLVWGWARIKLNSYRSRNQLAEVKARLELIAMLTERNVPPEVAEKLVNDSFEAVARRDKDDPVLRNILDTNKITKVLKAFSEEDHARDRPRIEK